VAKSRTLERSPLVLQVNSFVGLKSEGLALCSDFVHLPYFLVKYACARFHASHPHLGLDPVGLLLHLEVTDMVNMVQVVPSSTNKKQAARVRPGTIAPFNILVIRQPAAAGRIS